MGHYDKTSVIALHKILLIVYLNEISDVDDVAPIQPGCHHKRYSKGYVTPGVGATAFNLRSFCGAERLVLELPSIDLTASGRTELKLLVKANGMHYFVFFLLSGVKYFLE